MPISDDLQATVTRAFAETVADDSLRGSRMETRHHGEDGADAKADLPGIGDLVGGTYKLVRLLGEGMFGKVYAATRVDVPEHQVALKLVSRAHYAGRNVERELVMLATVGHPHVVQLKDHGTTGEYVWLTMPIYEGETLAERLKRGPLSLREAHDVFLPIAHGLEALHAGGLRHQDIKPDNLYLALFVGRVHPILLDLGVAAEKEAPFVAGTALYASPEQLLALTGVPGAIPLTEKMDAYCLGTTLLMALCGPKGFPGDGAKSRDEIAEAHELRAKRPLADDVLPELEGKPRAMLEDVLKRMLALDPADRPSMHELATDLDVLLEDERERVRAEDRRRARQKANLTRVSLAMAGMVVIGLGGAGYMYSKRETLRLAGELEQARVKGAESFDKLDTCIASHNIARREVTTCNQTREKERSEFKATLHEITRTGSATEADLASKAQAIETQFKARLRVCEDDADTAAKAAVAERERLAGEWSKKEASLVAERDAKISEIAALTQAKDQCATEKATCVAQRDACVEKDDPYVKDRSAAPPAPTAPLVPAAVTGGPAAAPPGPPAPPAPGPAPGPAPVADPYQ